jgi:hypothetical protein
MTTQSATQHTTTQAVSSVAGPDPWRPAVLAAGPAAIASVALIFAAAAADGGDPVKMASSGLGIGGNVSALAALVFLGIGLTGLAVRVPTLRHGFGLFAWAVATIGTMLTAGGYWSAVFVQPGLATMAPDAVRDGLPSLTAGFVVSYMAMGLGWILVAVALLRVQLVRVTGWFVILGGLVCFSPLPFRYLALAVAVSVAIGLRLRPIAG